MNKLEEKAINSKDIRLCYVLSTIKKGKDILPLEQVVLDSKNLYYNYIYARDVKNANVSAHAQIVLDSKNPEYNFYFAVSVYGSDYLKHKQVVNDSGNLEFNLRFAMLNSDIYDISNEEQVIINSRDPFYNYLFARLVDGADINAHLNILKESNRYNIRKRILENKVNKK